jgi:hypothetical protein
MIMQIECRNYENRKRKEKRKKKKEKEKRRNKSHWFGVSNKIHFFDWKFKVRKSQNKSQIFDEM